MPEAADQLAAPTKGRGRGPAMIFASASGRAAVRFARLGTHRWPLRTVEARMDDADWEVARLIPVSGINGADEQERRGSSALLAVLASVKEFGRAITVPLGAPAGAIETFIEVPFQLGERSVRPDGVIRVSR